MQALSPVYGFPGTTALDLSPVFSFPGITSLADGILPTNRYGPTQHAIYSELVDRLRDAEIEGLLDRERSFICRTRKGNRYWYSRRFVTEHGGDRREEHYLGPDMPELRKRIARLREQARDAKTAARARRRLVRQLVEAGFPYPDRRTGRVLEELARAGVFRLGGVLVGSHAFATYHGQLGVRLPDEHAKTSDVGVAAFTRVQIAISEHADATLGDAIGRAERFVAIPSLDRKSPPTGWRTADKEPKVELLTPLTGRPKAAATLVPVMGAHAEPIRFLDYLFVDTVPAIVLTGTGVLVRVPTPERYAVHKLIVARKRPAGDRTKRAKDRAQAASLLEVLLSDAPEDVAEAWSDLVKRGKGWEQPARQTLEQLPETLTARFFEAVG